MRLTTKNKKGIRLAVHKAWCPEKSILESCIWVELILNNEQTTVRIDGLSRNINTEAVRKLSSKKLSRMSFKLARAIKDGLQFVWSEKAQINFE